MRTKIIEATNVEHGGFNYGKFMVCQHDADDWSYESVVDPGRPLLAARGWSSAHIWVFDLQTGEGACFRHGGLASADLHKHQVWVCPMFEPFLVWLYKQDVTDISALPATVSLDDPGEWHGYRRPGPENMLKMVGENGQLRPLEELEADVIGYAIKLYDRNLTRIASALKIGLDALQRKMKRYGLDNDAKTT